MVDKSSRWVRRPEGSNWGDFGPDDQLGRLNLLGPEKVLQGMKEVQTGKNFCLSLPLDHPGGNVMNVRRFPPVLRPSLRAGKVNFNYLVNQEEADVTDIMNDDVVLMSLQYSTQWDALAHVGYLFDADGDGIPEPRYYNGYRGLQDMQGPREASEATSMKDDMVSTKSTSKATALGIENMAKTCVQGRAVMIDLHAHFGNESKAVTFEMLSNVMRVDGVTIERGDMVCLHTGLGQMIMDMRGKPDSSVNNSCAALDGRDPALMNWITDSGLACLIADNFGVEVMPTPGTWRAGLAENLRGCVCAFLPIHEHCIFKLGVPLGELWYLTELASWLRTNSRSRFLLTAPPLRLPGAVGSPVTGVGTV
jgi:hypothetical protein